MQAACVPAPIKSSIIDPEEFQGRDVGSIHAELRRHIKWGEHYHPGWDDAPGRYSEAGVVQRGRSRRLGLFQLAVVKAYIGVQHVDPSRPGWSFAGQEQARFFISIFVSGRTVTLRTFPTISQALDTLVAFLRSGGLSV